MTHAMLLTDEVELHVPSFAELNKHCEKLSEDHPGQTVALAQLLSKMNLRYYADVLAQAKQSFRFALVSAAGGVLIFICAAWIMYKSGFSTAWLGLVAGALLHVISGTCFYLYAKASSQFAVFHICLDRSNRFILANTLCDGLGTTVKDETRAYLVRVIAEATLLTPDVVIGKQRLNRTPGASNVRQPLINATAASD